MNKRLFLALSGLLLLGLVAFGGYKLMVKEEPQKAPKVNQNQSVLQPGSNRAPVQESFEAMVLEVQNQSDSNDLFGQNQIFQKLKLKGLDGNYKGKEFVADGIAAQNASKTVYKKGDKVTISHSTLNGQDLYVVTDYVRYTYLYILFAIFVVAVLIAGRKRGLYALLGLGFSFLVILKFIIPAILSGTDPLVATIFAVSLILIVSIYLAHGFNKKSTIAIAGTILGVFLVAILSGLFTSLARFAGVTSEETLFLNIFLNNQISLTNLLLAGIIISAVGFLNDVAITQASTVQELRAANPRLEMKGLYKAGMKVGRDHFASTVNTLFLAYAGASISLLLLFTFLQPPFDSISRILNNEIVAIEIMRALIGGIGIILAIPATTFIASYFFSSKGILKTQKFSEFIRR